MLPFNYHHLYYFYTIAKSGSVSNAARELRLAQPTLSAQLKQFEFFLGKQLFDRGRRRLELTEDGHEVLRYASLIFDLGKEFIDRQGDLGEEGRIRIQIGVGSSVPKTVVTLLIEYILRKAPSAYIVINENTLSHLMGELQDHLLDAILCDHLPESGTSNGLHTKLITKIPIHFYGHSKYKSLQKDFPRSLDQAPVILPTHSRTAAESVRAFFAEHKLQPRVLAEIQDLEVVRRMVLDGFGIAPLNRLTIEKAPSSRALILFGKSSKSLILEERIYLLHKKRKTTHPLVAKLQEGFKV